MVAPTLDYELRNAGILLNYEYGISDFRGKLYNKMKTNRFSQNKASKAYKTTLFPNDILMQSDQLLLYFPEKSNYLIHSVIYPFTGSLLFTIIILFTFYFTSIINLNFRVLQVVLIIILDIFLINNKYEALKGACNIHFWE